jgi:hypothetical protein
LHGPRFPGESSPLSQTADQLDAGFIHGLACASRA